MAVALQRILRWTHVAAAAIQLHLGMQQRQKLAFAGGPAMGVTGDGSRVSSTSSSAVTEADPAQRPGQAPDLQQSGAAVLGFISAATMGAVEQLRHTLTDATQGIESRMSAIEQTASSVQDTLFKAAQAHSEAVRSNPQGECDLECISARHVSVQSVLPSHHVHACSGLFGILLSRLRVPSPAAGGMWKQPCVDTVISEEERLRQAVFSQVYAELLLKDNRQLGFNAQP
jgi:hypothetical protein